MNRFSASVALALLAALPAAAADPVLEDQATRALARRDYERALPLFERLTAVERDDVDYRLKHALCLYETGKLPKARAAYEAILAARPDNVAALVALARLDGRSAQAEGDAKRRAGLVERGNEALRTAVRNGINGILESRLYPELRELRGDIPFALELIRTPRVMADPPEGRDPFYVPLTVRGVPDRPGAGDPAKPSGGMTYAEQEEIIKKLEALVGGLEAVVAQKDADAIRRHWAEIQDLRRRAEGVKAIDLAPKLKEIQRRYAGSVPIISSFLLGYYYDDGVKLIDAMRGALAGEDHRRALELAARLDALAQTMIATDARFETAARRLQEDAAPLVERARRLEEIAQIPIRVEAIVLGGGAASAVVNGGIVGEGDAVRDAQGNPIRDLTVLKIRKRRVRFQYRGLEFEPAHQLAPPQLSAVRGSM